MAELLSVLLCDRTSKRYQLSLYTSFHVGTYKFEMKNDDANETILMCASYPCSTSCSPSSTLGVPPIIARNEQQLTLKILKCVPPGQFTGNEIYDDDFGCYIAQLVKLTDCNCASSDTSLSHSTHSASNAIANEDNNETAPKQAAAKETKRKSHKCVFCGKLSATLARHIILMHGNEPRVACIKAMLPKSHERAVALRELRFEGDSQYNATINLVQRIVTRRPTDNNVTKFVECCYCKGSFGPKNFGRHQIRCTKRDTSRALIITKMRTLEFQNRLHDQSDILDKDDRHLVQVLQEGMHQDKIADEICMDKAINLLASGTALLNRSRKDRQYNDRERLRYAGKLIYIIKTKIDSNVMQLSDCFSVEKYRSHIIKAINIIAGYDGVNFTYTKPSVAGLYQGVLKELINTYLDYVLLHPNQFSEGYIKSIQDLERIHIRLFNRLVGKTARNCLQMLRLRRQNFIPNLQDVNTFTLFLKKQASVSYKHLLRDGFNYFHWKRLSQTVLVQLTIFNRRRVGEVSRLTLDLYMQKEGTSPELRATMSRLERVFADKFVAMKLLGKRERHLCVLIDNEQVNHIDVLLKYRNEAGIDPSNKYLFASRGKNGYFNAGRFIRDFSEQSGAQNPTTLRATLLRKQVATMSQLMNLSSNNIETLAKFMGHSTDVHRFTYRLTEMPLLGAKLANFLSAVSETDMSKFKGKNLEELEPLLEQPIYDEENDYPSPILSHIETDDNNDFLSAMRIEEFHNTGDIIAESSDDDSEIGNVNDRMDEVQHLPFVPHHAEIINSSSSAANETEKICCSVQDCPSPAQDDPDLLAESSGSAIVSDLKLKLPCYVKVTNVRRTKSSFDFSVLSPQSEPKLKHRPRTAKQLHLSTVKRRLFDIKTPKKRTSIVDKGSNADGDCSILKTPESEKFRTNNTSDSSPSPSVSEIRMQMKNRMKNRRCNITDGRKDSRHWSKQEDSALLKHFKHLLLQGHKPSKAALQSFLQANKNVFVGRTYQKTYAHLAYLTQKVPKSEKSKIS